MLDCLSEKGVRLSSVHPSLLAKFDWRYLFDLMFIFERERRQVLVRLAQRMHVGPCMWEHIHVCILWKFSYKKRELAQLLGRPDASLT